MKQTILFLALAPIFAYATENFSNTDSWVKISCHSDKATIAFSLTASSDHLNNVRQIQIVDLSSDLKTSLAQDSISADQHPLVSLAHLTQNQIQFSLRYENGLMWDTYLKIDMTRKQNKWQAHIKVSGDEGTYYDKNEQISCQIENSQKIFETSAGY